MANPVRRASRFDVQQPAFAQQNIRGIEQAGAGFREAISGFEKQISGIKEQEAKAMALIPDADFKGDSGPNSLFAGDAQALMQKIQGGVEGSYNFANPAEVARFNMDVANLKKEISEFEPIYNEAVKGLQKLSDEHDLFMKVGGDPKQAPTQKVGGIEYYNAKAGAVEFDQAMRAANAIRYGTTQKDPTTGKITLLDSSGNRVGEYANKEAMLQELVQIAKPELQPVPVVDGKTLVEDKKWGNAYKSEIDAESAFLNYVLNNPAQADRRRREKLGVVEDAPEAEMTEEVRDLLEKHPKTSEGFDSLSQSQYDYVQEMLQGWRDLQAPKEAKKTTSSSSSSKKLDGLIGQIGGADLTINTGLGELEESVGGTSGLVVKGKVGLDGGKEGSLKKIIYNPNVQEAGGSGFSVVIFDGEKDVVMPFDPKPGDQAKDAIAAALGLSQEDMLKLLKEIKIAGE